SQARTLLYKYIADQHVSVARTRGNLADDPKIVYKLPPLFEASMKQQAIPPDSIFDELIRDRRADYLGNEMIWKLALALLGGALTIVTLGTGGIVGAIAAGGALALSGYQALQEFKEFADKSAAADVGLLAENPSFAWVVLAVVGSVADLGSAVAAIKAIKPAVE